MLKDYYVKNMVCERCIKVLQDEIEAANMHLKEIELGRVRLDIQDAKQQAKLISLITESGFEIITSNEEHLTEQVKIELVGLLQNLPLELNRKLSEILSTKLAKDYYKISKTFSFTEGMTIEKYFIKLKIEKVKELIQNPEYNFSQISQMLDYNHPNHLSRQFKSETGMSLTQYRDSRENSRNPLDRIV
ncbi:Helix-turn-helix domain-containing protein [Flavobacteriaceae bacterium MAR_2010_188]|nr:Helix-turn-helix domain-containing protein [Flavobacteriaceae bacterium MAR_2010_188]